MKNIFTRNIKLSSFIVISSVCCVTLFVVSSFRTYDVQASACSGPFYSGNPFGASFSILGPGGTGAPGEPGTCGRSGCHNTADNTGPATFSLEISGDGITYIPGETYTITITIDQDDITAFDFELTSRANTDGTNAAGTFIITDPTRTKKTNGSFGGAGSNYVEGTACGIDALSSGHNSWTFSWKSPATDIGNITFYLGLVAANFDNTQGGDFTYAMTRELIPFDFTGLPRESANETEFKIYPNPVNELVSIDYTLKKAGNVSIKIIDLQGKLVDELLSEKEPEGTYHRTFKLKDKVYSSGAYFVQLKTDNSSFSKKLFIQ